MREVKMFIKTVILSLIFFGCDPHSDYDYYIINQCNEEIIVYVERTHTSGDSINIVIPPNEKVLIFHEDCINWVRDSLVEWLFEKITIQKGDKKSKVNYIDKNLWLFEPTSKYHANSYLIVNPEDFEDD